MVQQIKGYRLSPQQRILWQSRRGLSDPSALCSALIEGDLEAEALKRAVERLIERHEILRTTFHRLPGMSFPIQVVADRCAAMMLELDLTGQPARLQKEEIQRVWKQEEARTCSLDSLPGISGTLIRLSEREHALIVALPSLCADSASLTSLVKQLASGYEQCLGGEDDRAEPVQYAQFSEWQNELLESGDEQAGKDFWARQSVAHAKVSGLPFERKPAAQDSDGNHSEIRIHSAFALEGERLKRLEDVARDNRVTPDCLLFTCWGLLISRLTGDTEPVVCKLFHGRKYEELRDAIGIYAKMAPIKLSFRAEYRLREALRQASELIGDGYEWQEAYYPREVEARDAENSVIGYEYEEEEESFRAAGLRFSITARSAPLTAANLKLHCRSLGHSLCAQLLYDPLCFDSTDILTLAHQFQALVFALTHDSTRPVASYEVVTAEQKRSLLVEFNSTKREYEREPLLQEMIERQARARGGEVAVESGGESISYEELGRRGRRLGNYLRRRGVGPEVRVGVMMERGVRSVEAIVGVLKAGGAYVPIDEKVPVERRRYMLEDSGAKVVIREGKEEEGWEGVKGVEEIELRREEEEIRQESEEEKGSGVGGGNIAYVIYTSGSTGRPKGVAIQHSAVCNYIRSIVEILDLEPGSHFGMVSTLAADLGNTVLFSSLWTGGCLHIIREEDAADPGALAEIFRNNPIDCLKIVPNHLAALLSTPKAAQILPRRRLVLGGAASSWELIRKVRNLAPNCKIINHYGPTETTVGVLTHLIEEVPEESRSATVPLGRPIANTQVYVLDSWMNPAPHWVAGEIYIGGENLGRGYLGQPAMTAERFVPNPFSREPGSRLYRTGDLARHLPDGVIEFLGRADSQVKIRGFRVELGEIENLLESHDSVRNAVVVAGKDSSGDNRLVAYLLQADPNEPPNAALRSYLRSKLPEHMIPAAFVQMKQFPLTLNGKIDRRKLPDPDLARGEPARAYSPPRTEIERTIAGTWAEVLQVEKVGINDHFFDLGGHSLLLLQVHTKICSLLNREIKVVELFRYPTVASLAEFLSKNEGEVSTPKPTLDRALINKKSAGRQRALRQARLSQGQQQEG